MLAGDYNVIPEPRDAKRPGPPGRNDALFQPETRAKFRELLNLGLTDAVRACDDRPGLYTFWDYQAGAFQREQRHPHRPPAALAAGRRPPARRRGAARYTRGWEKPSDHVPVAVDLDLG